MYTLMNIKRTNLTYREDMDKFGEISNLLIVRAVVVVPVQFRKFYSIPEVLSDNFLTSQMSVKLRSKDFDAFPTKTL